MPQLSLYIDDDTLHKIETGAKINNVSISKFVSAALKEHFSKSWPTGYKNVFGSIEDESFTKHETSALPDDVSRENL